jgi:hypothetical protein
MSRALSNRFARLEGNSRGGETGVVVFPLGLDADRAPREADLTRSGLACASDCFLPIWQSASAESFAVVRCCSRRAGGPLFCSWRLTGARSLRQRLRSFEMLLQGWESLTRIRSGGVALLLRSLLVLGDFLLVILDHLARELPIEGLTPELAEVRVHRLLVLLGSVGGFTPSCVATAVAFCAPAAWSCWSVCPNERTPSLAPFSWASCPICTSARLPSIALVIKVWLARSLDLVCAHAPRLVQVRADARLTLTINRVMTFLRRKVCG